MARRFFLTLCITGLILPIATWAETGSQIEIHYAPQENLETVDVQEIGRAELSIDMAAYVLSDKEIIEALTDAAERDVVIRLYLDKSQFAEHGPVRGGVIKSLLAHPNVLARVKGAGVLMHLKAYAVDGQVLRTGSGNFSHSGLADQDNDLILITNQAIVDAFEANFERIWARAQNVGALDRVRRRSLKTDELVGIAPRFWKPKRRVALVTLIERVGVEGPDSCDRPRRGIALTGQNRTNLPAPRGRVVHAGTCGHFGHSRRVTGAASECSENQNEGLPHRLLLQFQSNFRRLAPTARFPSRDALVHQMLIMNLWPR